MLIINLTKVAQHVQIRNTASGETDSVRLMPRPGRGDLPDGFEVEPNWLARNPGAIKVHDPQQNKPSEVKEEPVAAPEEEAVAPEDTTDEGAEQ